MVHLSKSSLSEILIPFFFLIFSLFACSPAQKDKAIPLPNEPTINFPKMVIGEEWTIDTPYGIRHKKVIDVSSDGGFTLESKREDGSNIVHQFFDKNYRIIREININTGLHSQMPDPPRLLLNFPLFVGKTWDEEFNSLSTSGNLNRFKSSYTVDKIEIKTTKAGEFKTVKIIENQINIETTFKGKSTYWYSPDLKIIIKEEPTWKKSMELLSYRQATDKKEPLYIEKAPVVTKSTGTRWAAIIGVSQYKDTRIPPLRYAAADAKSFYDWAISPDGGKYAPTMVKLLLDAGATGANIKNALFDWLAQAIQEDTVTLFFAGHGSPQSPDHPENLFLLPYDTQYDNISTTGFPMWDIETALKRFIKAKKVIVITDACHAGGVGHAFDIARRDGRGLKAVPISSSLQNLSTISDGVCIISASDDNQFSQEGLQWGQGHGVFTYFLLEGLKGKADYNKDGLVTLGELIPFLSEQVRRETRNAQTPTVAGRFDPALSIGK
jgi:hypothetical protein